MSESQGEATGEAKKPPSKVVRYILFVVLGVGLVGLAFDLPARWACSSALEKLNAELRQAESFQQDVSRRKVRELLEREPEPGERPNIDIYVWPSVFRRYTIESYFSDDRLEECRQGSKWFFEE